MSACGKTLRRYWTVLPTPLPLYELEEFLFPRRGQTKTVRFLFEFLIGALATEISVHPSYGRRSNEAVKGRIEAAELFVEGRELTETVLLMIVFGKSKATVRVDFSIDLPASLLFDLCSRFLGLPPLFDVVHEDNGGVLTGPVLIGRIMTSPEGPEQIAVRYLRGIVVDLDGLGMVAESMVGGVLFFPACVPHARPDNASQAPEPGVRAPESAHCKGGRSDLFWREGVDQGFRRVGRGSKSARAHGMLPPFNCEVGRGTGNQHQQEYRVSLETGYCGIVQFGHGKLSHLSIVESNRNAKPEAYRLNNWE